MTHFHDELLRRSADAGKPSFSRLRYEGVSSNACIAIHAGRDALTQGWPAYRIARLIAGTGEFPFSPADVPPMERGEFKEHTVSVTDDWDELAERVLADWAQAERAVRGIGPRWDEESREVEASLERSDRFWRNHSRTEAAS